MTMQPKHWKRKPKQQNHLREGMDGLPLIFTGANMLDLAAWARFYTLVLARNGLSCINWSDSHRKPENYPDYLGDHNFCRYTGDHGDRAWCYTSTGGSWDYCDVPSCQGAYMQVFHTPDVPQTIDGVEFQNMGRQKEKNRFPIQFLYTRDVTGSSVSRKTIRNTMYRCKCTI